MSIPKAVKNVRAAARLLALIGMLCALSTDINAQTEFLAPLPLDTASPQATVRAFFAHRDAVEELFRNPKKLPQRELLGAADQLVTQMGRMLDVSHMAPTSRRRAAIEAVARLVDILDRVPLPPLEAIPNADVVPDVGKPSNWTVPGTEVRLVRMMQGERSGEFLFSAETVERLTDLYDTMARFPRKRSERTIDWTMVQLQSHGWLVPGALVASLPPSLKTIVGANPAWKLLVAAFVVATLVLVAIGGQRWSRSLRQMPRIYRFARLIMLPLVFGLLVWFARYILIEQVSLTSWAATLVDRGGTALIYLTSAWFVWLACTLTVKYIIASPTIPDESLDAHLLRLLGKVGGIASAGSIIAFGAQQIGLPVLGVLAGVGVGGLAVALAAQNSIENLIAGLNLYVDRPIRVGDWCRCGNVEGTVEQIGLRSTRIRGLDRTLTSIPNSDVAKAQLINFTMRDQMLFRHVLDLRYETSLDQLRELTNNTLAFLQTHPRIRLDAQAPRINIVELATWSIKVEVFAYVDAQRLTDFLPVQHDLLRALRSLVEETGVEFAFPSQTTYLRWTTEKLNFDVATSQLDSQNAP